METAETKLSAFTRPTPNIIRSSFAQEDYLYRDVSEFSCLAHTNGGLKSLYNRIRFADSQAPSVVNTHTDSDGHFIPRQSMILASRYHILTCIETSGQSAVLLEAEDCFREMMPVVIKVMHTSYYAVGLKEVQTLRMMNSADPSEISHTIRLLNSFRFENHICLVFPLLSPLPLTTVVAKKFHSKDEILSVFRKISLRLLSALAFLRQQNIIHADIKPENILMKKDGDLETVTLIDFGNAIHHIHQEVSLYYTDFQLQTQPYRAPEVHLGNPFGVEVDMWSFGCVLLELLTGQLVFAGTDRGDSLQKMIAILGPLPADMCKRGKFYSSELASVVLGSQKADSGALRLMSAFPCIRNYDFASFLSGLLTYHPDKRLTPWEALQHPFMAPLINIPYFLPDTAKDTGVIRKSDYSFKQNISSSMLRLYPSTFDLLRAGTSDPLLIEHANVAFVELNDLTSNPGKEVISQQECDNRSPTMRDTDAAHILSSKRTTSYRAGKCVSSGLDTTRSIKHELSHQRDTVTPELCQPSVTEQETALFNSGVKRDHVNSLFRMCKNKSEREVVESGQSQKVNSSHKNTSICKTDIQSVSFGSKSCNRKLTDLANDRTDLANDRTDLANDNHTVNKCLSTHKTSSFKSKSHGCQFKKYQLPKTDNPCETHEGSTISACLNSDCAGKMEPTDSRDTIVEISTSISECHSKTGSIKYKSSLRSKQNGSLMFSSKVLTQDKCLQVLLHKNCQTSPATYVPKATEHYSADEISNHADQVGSCPSGQNVGDTSSGLQKCQVVQSCCWQDPPQVYTEPGIHSHVREKVCVKNVAKCNTRNQLIDCLQTVKNEDEINLQNCLHSQTPSKMTLSSPGRYRNKDGRQPQLNLDDCIEKPEMAERDSSCTNICPTRDQVETNLDQAKTTDTCQRHLERDQQQVMSGSENGSIQNKKGCSLLNTTYDCADVEHKLSKMPFKTCMARGICNCQTHDQVDTNLDRAKTTDTCQRQVMSGSENGSILNKLGCSLLNTTYDCADVEHKRSKMPFKTYMARGINNCSHGLSTQEQRYSSELIQDVQHTHNKVQTVTDLLRFTGVARTLPFIDKTCKRSPDCDLESPSACVTTGNRTEGPVSEPDDYKKLAFVSRNESENVDKPRKELVVESHNIMKESCFYKCSNLNTSVQLPYSKRGKILSRKAKSDDPYVKEFHHVINHPESEVDIMEQQPRSTNLGQTDSPTECTETPFTQKCAASARNWVLSTLETVPTQYKDNFSKRDPCQVLEPESYLWKLPSVEAKNEKSSENSGTTNDAVNCREDSSLGSVSFQTGDSLRRARKRKHGQKTDCLNRAHRHLQKTKSSPKITYLTGSFNTDKDSKADELKTDMRKPHAQSKFQTAQRELFQAHCQKNSETLQIDNFANQKPEQTQFKDLTGSISTDKDSKTDKLKTDMRKPHVQCKPHTAQRELFQTHCQRNSETLQIDSFANQKPEQTQFKYITRSNNTVKDSKTDKLKTDTREPNVQSQTGQGELFHTNCQRKSETLQIDNLKSDVRNGSRLLNVSGISKSRTRKRGGTFQNDIGPVLNRNFTVCLTTKGLHNDRNHLQTASAQSKSQVAQERNTSDQPLDASRLFRAKAVKRALNFNTKRSSQIANNRKLTATRMKAASWKLDLQTPSLKAEAGVTCSKENDDFELSDVQFSGSNRRTNNKCRHLSPSLGDLNSSDPYEFKVTPVKLQQKLNVSKLKQTKTACRRRLNLRSQINKKRNNRLPAAVKSEVCSASCVTIRDLVEQKSRHLFQNISSCLSKTKATPLTVMVHKNPQKSEESVKKHIPTSEAQIIRTGQCKMIRNTELSGSGKKMLVSVHGHTKIPPSQGHRPEEVFESLSMSAKEESKLSTALNSFSSKDRLLVKTPVLKSNTVNKKGSQSVASAETNTVLGHLYCESQIPRNKQSVQYSETEELAVNYTSRPLHTRLDDYKPAGHGGSTVDFIKKLTSASDDCEDEESFSDEEVLLLD